MACMIAGLVALVAVLIGAAFIADLLMDPHQTAPRKDSPEIERGHSSRE